MASKPTTLVFSPWSASAAYKENDVINGTSSANEAYYYATQANVNTNPASSWATSVSAWTREDNKVKLTLSSTINPALSRGSYIAVTGAGYLNYTGCLFAGDATHAEYYNSGPDDSGAGSGGISSTLSPAWTTGFGWIPSYSTNLSTKTKKVVASFGDGYSQRQRDGINSNVLNLSLVFEDRTNREANAIRNFVEEKGGVDMFKIPNLGGNQCNSAIQYVVDDPKIDEKSYNINNIQLTAMQVFDPQ